MKIAIYASLFLGVSSFAFACDEKPTTVDAVYQCLLEKHPSLQALKYRGAESDARLKAAGQLPNPELEAKSLLSGEKETEIELLQPIEIGGRRSARKDQAQAEINSALVRDSIRTGEIAHQAAEGLTRLRQVVQGLTLLNEARASLTSITRRLQLKRAMTPEDRIALGLFRLFESTIVQKIGLNEAERDSLLSLIESASGRSLSAINWMNEQRRSKWPSLSVPSENATMNVRAAEAELSLAHADMAQASGQAWPDFRIGPSFKQLNETQENSLGLKVSMTLPLWNLNGGGRAFAQSKAQQAEADLNAAKRFERSTLASLKVTYEKATRALESAPKPGSLNKLVSESEKQFARGLIQPNALVEIYRSSLESLETTNETELQALKAYYQHESALGLLPKEIL